MSDTPVSSSNPPVMDTGRIIEPMDDLRLRRSNLGRVWKSPGQRAIIIVTLGVLVAAAGLSYINMARTAPASDQVAAGAQLGQAPSVTHQPGVNETSEHAALQQQANQSAYQNALKNNQSLVPVLTGSNADAGAITLPTGPAGPSQTGSVSVPLASQQVAPPAPVVVPPSQQTRPHSANAVANEVEREQNKTMDKQVSAYLTMWGPVTQPISMQEFNAVGQKPKTDEVSSTAAAAAAAAQQEKDKIRYLRAGTFVPGVLITPLDSDAPGPVLGEITTGPLAGARLIGQMQVENNGILVKFTTISKPGWPDTYTINAVAMDQADSTALATYINHHYVIKGMGLLGGAFLQGYGQGLQQQGQTTVVNAAGVVTSANQLNSSQVGKVALGTVGSKLGTSLQSSVESVPTTIRVQGDDGASFPIRILFLANF